MGHRALDYFGWEFAKEEEEKNRLNHRMKNQSIVDAVDYNELETLVVEIKQEKGNSSSILEPHFVYYSQETPMRPALDRSILKKVLLDDKFMKYCNFKYRIS